MGEQGSFKLRFNLGPIPVEVLPAFFLIALIGGASGGGAERVIGWMVILFGSILLHELGHALMMRQFGFAPRIQIHGLGGLTFWPNGALPNTRQSLLVSLSGPGIQLCFAALLFTVVRTRPFGFHPEAFSWAIGQLLWVNAFWAILNLLPMLPWDGGNALDSTLRLKFNNPSGWVGVISVLTGLAVCAFAATQSNIFMLYLGGMGVYAGYQRWTLRSRPLAVMLEQAKASTLPYPLYSALALELLTQPDPNAWRDQLRHVPDRIGVELFAREAYRTERFPQAALAYAELFERQRGPVTAINAAHCWMRAGRPDEAITWVQQGVDAGFRDRRALEEDPLFVPLKPREDFQALLARLPTPARPAVL